MASGMRSRGEAAIRLRTSNPGLPLIRHTPHMVDTRGTSVVRALRGSREGLTYNELRAKLGSGDEALVKRRILRAMRRGRVNLRSGRFVSSRAE